MDYEGLKNTLDFIYENIIPISVVTTGLFATITAGYFVKESRNYKKISKNGGLEQKTN